MGNEEGKVDGLNKGGIKKKKALVISMVFNKASVSKKDVRLIIFGYGIQRNNFGF